MRYYATRTIRTQSGRRTISCTKGQRNISESTKNKFSNRLQQYLVPMRNAPRAESLNMDQARYIVQSYLDNASTPDMIAGFIDTFGREYNVGGLECQYRIVAGADRAVADRGLNNPGLNLAAAMMELAPERFDTTLEGALDSLIGEIIN